MGMRNMSEHRLCIDVQELAVCIQNIRKELEMIEFIVQQSLIEAGKEMESAKR